MNLEDECASNFHMFVCFMSKNWCNFNRPCSELNFCHYHVLFVYVLVILVLCLITYLLQELFNEILKWMVEREDHELDHEARERRNPHYLLDHLR